jgi:hypothetical protein
MSEKLNRYDELLHRDWYTAEDLADLLEVPLDRITSAVFSSPPRLQAKVIDGHIIEITRKNALIWLTNAAKNV